VFKSSLLEADEDFLSTDGSLGAVEKKALAARKAAGVLSTEVCRVRDTLLASLVASDGVALTVLVLVDVHLR